MMYPFLTLDDGTEIVHSELKDDGPRQGLYRKAGRPGLLPSRDVLAAGLHLEDVFGFSDEDVKRYQQVIESTAHLIMRFSQEGGFDGAASF